MGFFDTIAPGKKKSQTPKQSTQVYLRMGEIRSDLLILKNGGARAVLKTTSINFNLKSEQEQNAIIYSYQNFLNSLEFPIQIVVRSKKLDVDDYIDQVKSLGDKQKNQLLKEQTYEYGEYIKKLVEYADIMEKSFYVIIPYDPGRARGGAKNAATMKNLSPQDNSANKKIRKKEFEHIKKAMSQRINVITAGLENCGLQVTQLETPEIIELFYKSYNPQISQTVKIKDPDSLDLNEEETPIL